MNIMRFKQRISLIFGLIILILPTLHAQKAGWVTLKGQLKNFNNQVQIDDMSEFQYLLPPDGTRLIIPDSVGNFSVKFRLDKPNYYRIGRNQLYLTPGDDLEVYIDYKDPTKAKFQGPGESANNYLKYTPFPKAGSFIEAGGNIKNTPQETLLEIERLAHNRTLSLAITRNTSAEFKRLETARIKGDIINSLQMGLGYSKEKFQLRDTAGKSFTERYNKTVEPTITKHSKDFIDPSLMKLVVYRDIADELIKNAENSIAVAEIADWYKAYELVNKMQKISDKKQLATFKTEIATIKTNVYKDAVNKMLAYLMAFGKGDKAVDFTAYDLKGGKINLSSLKGKVIYVDLWATWCGPCMQEMPYFEKLKAKYANNPNVAFVSLSIDDSNQLWQNSINQRKADGFQWIINRSKLQAYNIVGIPRSLLIDKDFKMVDLAAPMPSQAAAEKQIEALLK
jgi:thiol-disulfide isomerase/thioredoxin